MADLKESSHFSPEEEIRHWWIKTRLFFLEKCLSKTIESLKIVEWGCGTGQNLYYLRKNHGHRIEILEGFDTGLTEQIREQWLEESDYLGPPRDGRQKYNFALAMDVLEHIEDDSKALKDWIGSLEPGSHIVITVPAFSFLWSSHDEILKHYRRHTKKTLRTLAAGAGLQEIKVCYLFSWAVPIVYVMRKVFRKSPGPGATDLAPTNPILNFIFTMLGKIEVSLGGHPLWGTSVAGCFKVPEKS